MAPLTFFAVVCCANAVGADTIRPKEEKRRQGSALHYIFALQCTLLGRHTKCLLFRENFPIVSACPCEALPVRETSRSDRGSGVRSKQGGSLAVEG